MRREIWADFTLTASHVSHVCLFFLNFKWIFVLVISTEIKAEPAVTVATHVARQHNSTNIPGEKENKETTNTAAVFASSSEVLQTSLTTSLHGLKPN